MRRAFGGGGLLRREFGLRFVFDLEQQRRVSPRTPLLLAMREVGTNGDLEVHELLSGGAHLVAEAELVVAHSVGSKDKVSLPLLLALQNDLVAGADDRIVDIERPAGLDLDKTVV